MHYVSQGLLKLVLLPTKAKSSDKAKVTGRKTQKYKNHNQIDQHVINSTNSNSTNSQNLAECQLNQDHRVQAEAEKAEAEHEAAVWKEKCASLQDKLNRQMEANRVQPAATPGITADMLAAAINPIVEKLQQGFTLAMNTICDKIVVSNQQGGKFEQAFELEVKP